MERITVVFKIKNNPHSSFYFQTHKCIGNTAHSIPNLKHEDKLIKFGITLQNVKKN